MRIYGGHDYYDCGLSMGIDPTITLVRGTSDNISAKALGLKLPTEHLELHGSIRSRIGSVCVVFCDKIYHGVAVFRQTSGLGLNWEEPEYIWSAEKLRKWIEGDKGLQISVYVPWEMSRKKNKPKLEEYFKVRELPEGVRNCMIDRRISILVGEVPKPEYISKHSYWRRDKLDQLHINPATLKLIGFAKALDPYTAFQELGMWIGGVLGGTSPEIVTIKDDKVLAEGHGYDKYSFRSQSRPV